jgi:hypothetical protein
MPYTPRPRFLLATEQRANLLLTIKDEQRRLYQQISCQFRGHRHFPVEISDVEAGHSRRVHWQLKARNATDAIRQRWAGASWIIELIRDGWRGSKRVTTFTFSSPPCAPARKRCCVCWAPWL